MEEVRDGQAGRHVEYVPRASHVVHLVGVNHVRHVGNRSLHHLGMFSITY